VRWLLVVALAVVAVGSAALVRLAHSTPKAVESPPQPRFTAAATWPARAHAAPAFALHDPSGKPLTLASLRGRPVLVTFIDPVCRNLCPLEARVIEAATAQLPQSPAIVSVSVNPWADSRANFALDKQHWGLGANWHWAVGTHKELANVWRRYQIAVAVATKKVAGITVRQIAHTEATFVIGPHGDERAVYLYPFSAKDLAQTVRDAATG
jgi:cytochrome oxidase Cu insertion factor (SCO1/SenC/PrrC family)